MKKLTLDSLGWDSWFEAQARTLGEAEIPLARVATVDRDQLLLVGEDGFFRAKLSGKYMYESESASERPCVGYWVCVEKPGLDQFGLIHKVFERRTCLRRKAAGDLV